MKNGSALNMDFEQNGISRVGAIDGKHINIFAPDDSSDYYNFKGAHSVILLALVDHDYCFSYVDIETNGRASDGGVFHQSSLGKALEKILLIYQRNQSL